MNDSEIQQLQEELKRRDLKDAIMSDGDKRWASKLAERIIFGLCALIFTGVVLGLLTLLFNKGGGGA